MSQEDYMRYVHMNLRPGAKPLYVKPLKIIEARAEHFNPPSFNRITAETAKDAVLFLRKGSFEAFSAVTSIPRIPIP
ncbi:hypothetical protein [Marinobacter xiaoshiensis]|uniref:Uncharacterized protein n=1 Tax=Marinobacter xiaoshiensis TaxID=3073652 RepID=A0ABU2HF09_9GAMM|nr:hypothetical protein [Marinobacter sp. F60267]MDS1309636.1 hypothetical protein [Marinobacter sp. F60267]